MENEDIAVNLAELDMRLRPIEMDVSNFRSFQTEVREFITDYRARDEERQKIEKRRSRNIQLWMATLTLLFTFFSIVPNIVSSAHHKESKSTVPQSTRPAENPN
jgi:hypothetical protein